MTVSIEYGELFAQNPVEEVADGVDPSELPALDDALADPGEADY